MTGQESQLKLGITATFKLGSISMLGAQFEACIVHVEKM